MSLTVGSLFSGIGGIDLGLERAGHKVIWQSEIDPYACRVLQKHWPKVTNYGDIKKIDWATVERPDIICGGYPCQPFSTAGKRRGADDPRHLWPWVRQAISELRPRYAMLENVRGHLSMGATTVIGELAQIGYDAEWRIISAAGVGAPHRRDRIIIVAYPNSNRSHRTQINATNGNKSSLANAGRRSKKVANPTQLLSNGSNNNTRDSAQPKTERQPRNNSWSQNVANANSAPRQQQHKRQICKCDAERCGQNVANTSCKRCAEHGQPVRQTQAYTVFGCGNTHTRGHDFAAIWQTEPNVGRMANGVPNRVDRLRGLGNAVVPQVAELVGRLIGEHAAQFK